MDIDSFDQQLNFTTRNKRTALFGTPDKGTPDEKSPAGLLDFGSPDEKSPAGLLDFGSPDKGTALFGTPDKGTALFRTPHKGTPDKGTPDEGTALFGTSLFGTPDERTSHAVQNEKEEFVQQYYYCLITTPIKSAGSRDPLCVFCTNLINDGVFTKSPQHPHLATSPSIGKGSFFSVHEGMSPKTVVKTANVGSNSLSNLDPTSSQALMTKTDVLDLLNASRRSHGNPQVVKTLEMYFSHVSKDNGNLTIVQEKCSPLPKNMAGLLGLINCVIALHKSRLPVSDVKPANFMVTAEGLIVCVDLDLREPKKGVHKLVLSGEYRHTIGVDVSDQFKQLLLVFLETLGHPIGVDRKPDFLKLYEEKCLLQFYGLLSSDMSVYETKIEDFQEVLQNIGLSDEDITYLVGLLIPPASSQ